MTQSLCARNKCTARCIAISWYMHTLMYQNLKLYLSCLVGIMTHGSLQIGDMKHIIRTADNDFMPFWKH